MLLYNLLQKYEFDDLMPVIADMFPGTGKFRKQLNHAYDLMMRMRPVATKKNIRYKIIESPNGKEQYLGAEDRDFAAPWETCLGKDVQRSREVTLSEIEMAANAFVNVALVGKGPASFDADHQILLTPDR